LGFTFTDTFAATGNFASAQQGNVGVYAGSAGLFNNAQSSFTRLSQGQGGTGFSLNSIDLSALSSNDTGPIQLTFTGTFVGGGTTVQVVTVNLSFGFQTLALNPTFTNLAFVDFGPQGGHPAFQFDNVVVTSTPTPTPTPTPPTITFDALELSGTDYTSLNSYTELGFTFTDTFAATCNFASAQQGNVGVYAGSPGLFNNAQSSFTRLSQGQGGTGFSLNSIDLSALSSNDTGPIQLFSQIRRAQFCVPIVCQLSDNYVWTNALDI
jgi:hypothetical protein